MVKIQRAAVQRQRRRARAKRPGVAIGPQPAGVEQERAGEGIGAQKFHCRIGAGAAHRDGLAAADNAREAYRLGRVVLRVGENQVVAKRDRGRDQIRGLTRLADERANSGIVQGQAAAHAVSEGIRGKGCYRIADIQSANGDGHRAQRIRLRAGEIGGQRGDITGSIGIARSRNPVGFIRPIKRASGRLIPRIACPPGAYAKKQGANRTEEESADPIEAHRCKHGGSRLTAVACL